MVFMKYAFCLQKIPGVKDCTIRQRGFFHANGEHPGIVLLHLAENSHRFFHTIGTRSWSSLVGCCRCTSTNMVLMNFDF